MSSEYYSLEKTAEVLSLPTAEVNRLREKSQLRAFRDGSSWKFRKVDVDNYLAELIKSRGKGQSGESDDFDLTETSTGDSASFDALMEDGLELDDDLIDASAKPSESSEKGFELADDDFLLDDDGLSLSTENGISLPDDATAVSAATLLTPESPEASDVDLAIDDDSLLLDDGSSAQLDLAGESGLSLLEIADEDLEPQAPAPEGDGMALELDDDDDILSLVDDEAPPEFTSTMAIPVEDDFQLTPDADSSMSDDSDSASQVIALDKDTDLGAAAAQEPIGPIPGGIDFQAPPQEDSPFGAVPGVGDFAAAPEGAFGAPEGGFGAPFGAGPADFAAPGTSFPAATSTEATYTPLLVTSIILVAFFLILPGMMLLDLIIHIWSWGEPFVINSTIMETLCSMLGLK